LLTSFAAYALQYLNRNVQVESVLFSSQPMFFSLNSDDEFHFGHGTYEKARLIRLHSIMMMSLFLSLQPHDNDLESMSITAGVVGVGRLDVGEMFCTGAAFLPNLCRGPLVVATAVMFPRTFLDHLLTSLLVLHRLGV